MALSAGRVYAHICFLARPGSFVDREEVLRHFRIPPDQCSREDVDEVLRSLAVGGFVNLLPDLVWLTGRRLPGFQGAVPGEQRRAPQNTLQVRAAAGVVLGADDDGVVLSAGPGAVGWDPHGDDSTAAYFGDEELGKLRRALEVTARQARFGRDYEVPVEGSDIGDVVLRARDGQVEMTVVPYGWDRATFDADHGDPADDVPLDYEDDDTGATRLFSPEERGEMLADARREHDKRWQEHVAARPDLTTLIGQDQVDQLLAILTTGPVRPAPAGVPDV